MSTTLSIMLCLADISAVSLPLLGLVSKSALMIRVNNLALARKSANWTTIPQEVGPGPFYSMPQTPPSRPTGRSVRGDRRVTRAATTDATASGASWKPWSR